MSAKIKLLDAELSAADLTDLVARFEEVIRKHTGREFPEDPQDQLWGAIGAVFRSWDNQRAKTYRKLHHIPDDWGTAVNVQAMVFGNRGETSATGVAFTRDPSTGEKRFYGEFLPNAQGEDVVAGIRTPRPLNRDGSGASLEETMPAAHAARQAVDPLDDPSVGADYRRGPTGPEAPETVSDWGEPRAGTQDIVGRAGLGGYLGP